MPKVEDLKGLVDLAERARQGAYAPYSRYPVGAALLTSSGQVFTGCNVENASYGLTMCAERVAIFRAVAAGEHEFQALAVSTANGGSPCGACRQVMVEFAPEMTVAIASPGHIHQVTTALALLPGAFLPDHLPDR